MTRPRIVHLIDDTAPDGVMRVLDHIIAHPEMTANGRHEVHIMRRNALSFRRIKADIIVSHLTISWRMLPRIIALQATYGNLPILHVEHNFTEAFVASEVQNRRRFATLLRTAYARFDKVVAVSGAQGRWLVSQDFVPAESLEVIPSAVNVTPFLEMDAPVAGSPVRMGAIGRLDKQKGFDTLIEAFVALPEMDTRLDLFGEGPEREALEALAQGDDRITFHGHVDPVEAMSSIDVLVMPSRWEGYGLAALEARAAGRRLIVSGVDGLADHIAGGARPVAGGSLPAWKRALVEAFVQPDLPGFARERRVLAAAEADGFAQGWIRLIAELRAASQPQSKGEQIGLPQST
ncbi:MAG: glycosyltransferase family 4 protein [Flavimaricola sp.]|nr:glycosyltransferase family 4 protein [Flavimaricola sp.]